MLRIVNVEELEALLREVPELVRRQQSRSAGFTEDVRSWLASLHAVFAANRMHQVGRVAALLSSLASVEQGQVPTWLTFHGKPTRARMLQAAAAEALRQATEFTTAVVDENQGRFKEAERIAQQVVATARGRGLTIESPMGAPHAHYLRALRQVLSTYTDLQSAVVHVEGLVGPQDTLIVLDRVLAAQSHTR